MIVTLFVPGWLYPLYLSSNHDFSATDVRGAEIATSASPERTEVRQSHPPPVVRTWHR